MDHARAQPLADGHGAAHAGADDGGGQAALAGVGQLHGLVVGAEGDEVGHGAEGLFVKRTDAGLDAGEHRGLIAQAVEGAARLQLGALLDAVVDHAVKALELLGVDHRPQGHLAARAVAYGQVRGLAYQPLQDGVGNRFVHQDAVGGHADLPLVEPCAKRSGAGGGVRVGVFQDDEVVGAAQLQRHLLEVLARQRANAPAHRGRAGEGDHGHALVHHQRLARLGVAGHHLQQARGQARLFKHAGHDEAAAHRRARVGLEHHRIAQRQRRGHRAQAQDEREVERRDHAHHPVWHAPRNGQAPRRAGQHLALGLHGQGCCQVAQRDGLAHLVLALGQDGARLPRNGQGQLIKVLLKNAGGAVEHCCPLARPLRGPGALCLGCAANRGLHVGRAGNAHGAQHLAGGGLGDVAFAAQRGLPRAIKGLARPQAVVQQARFF